MPDPFISAPEIYYSHPAMRVVSYGYKGVSPMNMLIRNKKCLTVIVTLLSCLYSVAIFAGNGNNGQSKLIYVKATVSGVHEGVGTKKNPYTTLAQVEVNSSPGDIITVVPSLHVLDGGITLKDGQSLKGTNSKICNSSPVFHCDLTEPASRITNSPGSTTNDGDAVVLANNNTIMWLHIGGIPVDTDIPNPDGPAMPALAEDVPLVPAGMGISGNAIFGDNVTGTNIHHVTIAGANQDGASDAPGGPKNLVDSIFSDKCDVYGFAGTFSQRGCNNLIAVLADSPTPKAAIQFINDDIGLAPSVVEQRIKHTSITDTTNGVITMISAGSVRATYLIDHVDIKVYKPQNVNARGTAAVHLDSYQNAESDLVLRNTTIDGNIPGPEGRDGDGIVLRAGHYLGFLVGAPLTKAKVSADIDNVVITDSYGLAVGAEGLEWWISGLADEQIDTAGFLGGPFFGNGGSELNVKMRNTTITGLSSAAVVGFSHFSRIPPGLLDFTPYSTQNVDLGCLDLSNSPVPNTGSCAEKGFEPSAGHNRIFNNSLKSPYRLEIIRNLFRLEDPTVMTAQGNWYGSAAGLGGECLFSPRRYGPVTLPLPPTELCALFDAHPNDIGPPRQIDIDVRHHCTQDPAPVSQGGDGSCF
ncbi:MAG: hypothetical protein ACJATP_002537 [Candidatus Azotimanducaceae bacterium]